MLSCEVLLLHVMFIGAAAIWGLNWAGASQIALVLGVG